MSTFLFSERCICLYVGGAGGGSRRGLGMSGGGYLNADMWWSGEGRGHGSA